MLRERGERVPDRKAVQEKIEEPSVRPVIPSSGETTSHSVPEANKAGAEDLPVPGAAELPAMDTLKDQILGALRRVRHSLAAAMEKAESWDISGTNLTLIFKNTFESSFLEKERHEIEKIILESLNYSLHLKTQLRKHEDENMEKNVEEQVELVRSVFRGTIMKRSQS